MGCDIHLGVEVRNHETGKWETWLGTEQVCSHCGGKHYWWDEERDDEIVCAHCDVRVSSSVEPRYHGRNYVLFGLLAGVRYRSVPYIEPRGLPDDVDPRTPELFLENNVDGHSTSWLTVTELRAIDLDFRIEDYACVSFAAYERWRQDKTQLCETQTWEAASMRIEDYEAFMAGFPTDDATDNDAAARARWAAARLGAALKSKRGATCVYGNVLTTVRSHVAKFFEQFLPAIAKLGAPDDVRIVFNFDN